jgi:hypothetical protein
MIVIKIFYPRLFKCWVADHFKQLSQISTYTWLWFLKLIWNKLNIKLIQDMTDFGISHTLNFWYWTLSKIGGGCNHVLLIYNPLIPSFDVFVIKSQVLYLKKAYFKNKIQGSVVPRSIMTDMNYFEYQYGQASIMPKFNHEKHEICLVPKMPCFSYNE